MEAAILLNVAIQRRRRSVTTMERRRRLAWIWQTLTASTTWRAMSSSDAGIGTTAPTTATLLRPPTRVGLHPAPSVFFAAARGVIPRLPCVAHSATTTRDRTTKSDFDVRVGFNFPKSREAPPNAPAPLPRNDHPSETQPIPAMRTVARQNNLPNPR